VRHIEGDMEDNHWVFEIVRSCRWDLSLGNFEDGSAYWLHLGPVCFTFGFKGAMPVEPLRTGLAFSAIKAWLLNYVRRVTGRR